MKGSRLGWVMDCTWLSCTLSSNQQNVETSEPDFCSASKNTSDVTWEWWSTARMCSSEIHKRLKYLVKIWKTIHQRVKTFCSGLVTVIQEWSQIILMVSGWRITNYASVFFSLSPTSLVWFVALEMKLMIWSPLIWCLFGRRDACADLCSSWDFWENSTTKQLKLAQNN